MAEYAYASEPRIVKWLHTKCMFERVDMKDASTDFNVIDAQMIKSVFEYAIQDKLHSKDSAACPIHELRERKERWQREGAIIVFTAGVFDILHVNHLLALTHYRLLGAKEYLDRNNLKSSNSDDLHKIAASSRVRLIISSDSDARAAADKSFVAGKGDCPKPLVSWENRALLLACQQITRSDGSAWPLVDYITMHGTDSCLCDSCPYDDNAYIATALQPDVVVVSSGSPSTIQKLKKAAVSQTKLVIIEEGKLAYTDRLLDGPIKSSAIIRRAKSKRT